VSTISGIRRGRGAAQKSWKLGVARCGEKMARYRPSPRCAGQRLVTTGVGRQAHVAELHHCCEVVVAAFPYDGRALFHHAAAADRRSRLGKRTVLVIEAETKPQPNRSNTDLFLITTGGQILARRAAMPVGRANAVALRDGDGLRGASDHRRGYAGESQATAALEVASWVVKRHIRVRQPRRTILLRDTPVGARKCGVWGSVAFVGADWPVFVTSKQMTPARGCEHHHHYEHVQSICRHVVHSCSCYATE
jgi:hypothetical protein